MGLVSKIHLLSFLCCLCLNVVLAIDTIRSSQPIKDPNYIISNRSTFKLGFFSPENSTNRYVGIWYNKTSASHAQWVWVANRDKPLKDSSGVLTISGGGNLVVLDGQRKVLWSSNITNSSANVSAQLLDSGNLVLRDNNIRESIIWESFQHPSHTLLPTMKISSNTLFTSWKSPSDPSIGSFTVGFQIQSPPQGFIWKDGSPRFRSGPWNGRAFIGVPEMFSTIFQSRFSLEIEQDGTVMFSYFYTNGSLTYLVLTAQGDIEQRYWDYDHEDWVACWNALKTACHFYGKCGAFGRCDSRNSPICSCLQGFEPKNTTEWNRGNWTSGCVRRTPLQCGSVSSTGSEGDNMDGFLEQKMLNVPDFADYSDAHEDDCRQQCSKNCSCIAYAYDAGIGCMSWTKSLIDTQKLPSNGVDLHIRVAHSELDTEGDVKKIAVTDSKGDVKKIVRITVVIGTVSISICTFILWSWIAKHKARKKKGKEIILLNIGEAHKKVRSENMLGDNLNQLKDQELPLFDFEELANATNNFHQSNKLGQGGFGPVYRGILSDGQEIAVKRLSKTSGQGLEEFMNEVVVISKLQHRNLVRIHGCCVEGEERMLIYEYMPNKSLDAFLFDPQNEKRLDWRKRFNIIEGISRGLLYLHRDSRLKIIHRDLKASNILLDKELHPKISDFGTARIFQGNEDQANTRRVVGTYGYMSPEYALEGQFSEKSDVFSFGVLLLEIVSGRRNTSIYNDEQSLSLLGLAWKLWNADNIVALIDPMIYEPYFEMEILRCIQVGLLCVQEFAKNRPTISAIVSMLKSEIVDLPPPKKSAFTERNTAFDTESSQLSQSICSTNNVTFTTVQGQ